MTNFLESHRPQDTSYHAPISPTQTSFGLLNASQPGVRWLVVLTPNIYQINEINLYSGRKKMQLIYIYGLSAVYDHHFVFTDEGKSILC